MTVINQQVTMPEMTNAVRPVLGMKPHKRGLAGNHTRVAERFLQRKCACSGQCEKCKKTDEVTLGHALQTKISLGAPGDRYEQEADRVSEQVLTTSTNSSVENSPPRIQRFATQSSGETAAAPKSVDDVLSSPGRPLNPGLRRDMEQRFGYDFSQVRVHSGAAAGNSAGEVNAHAYTVGRDIVFGPGRFAPTTQEGRRLIAHELTHFVQQSEPGVGAKSTKVQRKVVDDDEHLPCRNTPRRSAQFVADLEDQAATLAENAAIALRARPPIQSTQEFLWKRFRRNFNEPRDRCGFIPEIADRLDAIARGIRNTEVQYGCVSAGEPSSQCNGHFAYTDPGMFGGNRIDLCARFWAAKTNDKVVTILHEWAHYKFEPRGVMDEPQGGFDAAECYSSFAAELGNFSFTEFEDASKCEARTGSAPPLDSELLHQACPRNVFLNVSALTGLAANVPGSSHFAGVGVSLVFPVTRLHDWEKSLGLRYLRFAPEDDRGAQMLILRGDLAFRRRPRRYGSEHGAHVEGGILALPSGAGGTDVRGYVGAGVSYGKNIRISEDLALRIVGEVDVGRATAREDEKGFWLAKAGLSIGFTWD